MAKNDNTAPSDKVLKRIRVLIADDHPGVRTSLSTVINRQDDMETVAEAADGRAAVEQFVLHRPDIVLADIRMPRLNGIAAAAKILNLDSQARVILLSSHETQEYLFEGIRIGVRAFVLKGTTLKDLLDAIRRVHAGFTRLPPPVAIELARRVSHQRLSGREEEVFGLLADGKNNKEIGVLLHLSENTVKTHVNNLLKKLKANSTAEAIRLVSGHGYR